MMQVLKVLGRVILISFGLICIAAGGLCTFMDGSSGRMGIPGIIGIVSLLVGAIVVWQTFSNWLRKPAPTPTTTDTSHKETP